jgi:cytochrome b561
MHERFVGVHEAGGWILLALLLLHIGGALKHQWIDKHAELARMGVGRVRPS